jgi:hypothetical protein
MTHDQLVALCGVLVVLLGVSESLPFMRRIKSNGWAQLLIAAIRAVAATKPSRR